MASAPHKFAPRDLDPPLRYFPITVDIYHKMIQSGLLPEGAPYELINGQIVAKDRSAAGEDAMTVGLFHALAISNLVSLDALFRRCGCHVRIQLPLGLPDASEPEPDAAIVIGDQGMYRAAHPVSKDVLCAIEVADSSLKHDRTTKLSLYAAHNIAMYVIVNLVDRVLEVYADPKKRSGRYTKLTTLSGSQRLIIETPRKPVAIPIKRLLP